MSALEPHRVVSVNALQPSRPLGGPPWLRAAQRALDATVFKPDEHIAVPATESIVKLITRRTLETDSVLVTPNGAASTTSTQYP